MSKKNAVLALSGGMDSTGCLLYLLAHQFKVVAVSFRYGQKHIIEIQRAQMNVAYLRSLGHEVEHRIVDISSMMSLYSSALTTEGIEVPEGHYEQDNMKATVVPNRNAIFSSLIYGLALSIGVEKNEEVALCLGVHSGDHCIPADAWIDCPNEEGWNHPNYFEENSPIYSCDPSTVTIEDDVVVRAIQRGTPSYLLEIEVEGMTGPGKMLAVTGKHLVWKASGAVSWDNPEKVEARDLELGDYLIRPKDRKRNVKIVNIKGIKNTQPVFDLEVQKNHNYIVNGFLVSNSIYPDCRPEFYEAIGHAFSIGNWDSEKVVWLSPYMEGNKTSILQDALRYCKILKLNFDTIFANTNTSYNPDDQGRSSGTSGADVERILAFDEIGRKDPVAYSAPWEEVREKAISVRDKWEKDNV